MTPSLKKYVAEGLGAALLVLLGCGAVTLGGAAGPAGNLIIALAFGLGLAGIIYAIGPLSGAHVNPAVTLGAWFAGRISTKEGLNYIIAQCIGATLGAALLLWLLHGQGSYDVATLGLGQNGWGQGYLGAYSLNAAFVVEAIATFFFVSVILRVAGSNTSHAGLAIGATLAALILVFLPVTGVSVNPARSLGPALLAGGTAMEQLWLFLLVPSFAGALAGWTYKRFG